MAAHPVTDPAAPQTGRRRFFLSLALCLALLLLRVADLALCTDPATGFVRDSGFALRLAAPLAAALVNWLLARKAAPRPAALLGACPPLGYCLLATGVALGTAAFLYWGDPLAARRYGVALVVLFCACGALSAVWFLRFGVRAFAPLADPTAPAARHAEHAGRGRRFSCVRWCCVSRWRRLRCSGLAARCGC